MLTTLIASINVFFSLAMWRGFGFYAGVAVVIAVIGLAFAAWRPFETGTLLWLAGPLFGSSFVLGSINLDQLMILLGAAILCVAALRNKSQLRVTSLTVLSLAMALSVGFTAFANKGIGAIGVVRFACTAIASVILMSAAAKYSGFLMRSLIICSVVSAIIVIMQPYVGWPAPYADVVSAGLRYGGLIGHPNFAGYSLATAALAVFIMARRRRDYLPLAILIPAVILTGARTALIIFVLVLIGYAVIRRPKSLVWLGLAGAALLPLSQVMISRLQSVSATGGIEGANSSGWRFIQWQRSWALGDGARGVGIGWQRASELLSQNLGVHNLYLEVAVELGYLGVAFLLIGIVAVIIGARHSPVKFATCLFALGASIADPVLLYPSVLAIVVLIWAADDSAHRAADESAKRSADLEDVLDHPTSLDDLIDVQRAPTASP